MPAPYGWRYQFGPAFWPGLVATLAGCAVASLRLMRSADPEPSLRRRLRDFGAVIWLPIAVASVTDVALPALSIDGPRLGALSIVLSGGVLWFAFFSAGNGNPAVSSLARQFLDQLPDGVAILRADGVLRWGNQRLGRILRRGSDLIGVPVDDWLGGKRPSPLGRMLELRVETPGGSVPVALWESEIADRQGEAIGRVLVVRDQRAIVDLRHQLVSSGQMSALGELAAGIAHEVNNPIAYVLANLNQLRRDAVEAVKDPSSAKPLAGAVGRIEDCIASLRRVVDFVAEVRDFAHQGSSRPAPYAVNALVEGTLRLATPRLRERHAVRFEPGELPELLCAAQELKHALLCLLMTVGEIAPRGEIVLRTLPTAFGGDICIESGALPGEGALFEHPELLLAGGESLQSLGLMIPRHLVRQQGGRLSVEPLPTGGSLLRISLRSAQVAT